MSFLVDMAARNSPGSFIELPMICRHPEMTSVFFGDRLAHFFYPARKEGGHQTVEGANGFRSSSNRKARACSTWRWPQLSLLSRMRSKSDNRQPGIMQKRPKPWSSEIANLCLSDQAGAASFLDDDVAM